MKKLFNSNNLGRIYKNTIVKFTYSFDSGAPLLPREKGPGDEVHFKNYKLFNLT